MRNMMTLLLALVAFSFTAQAQMELPQPSPKAEIEQMVGLTEIEIEYSSPGVKGRDIFGGLVPYGKIWRTGANKATALSFSRDVMIADTEIPAGEYSLFTIPGEDEWTIILNSETELWGTGSYDETNDVVRFTATPEQHDEFVERFRILVEDFDNEKAHIAIEWADVVVSFPVMVHTKKQAYASIEETLSPSWQRYAQAARYAWEQEGDLDNAGLWASESIAVESTWYNHWIMGEVLAEQGDTEAALEHMNMALELGNEAENFWYKSRVEENIENWTAKK